MFKLEKNDLLLVDFWDTEEVSKDLIAILDKTTADSSGLRYAFVFVEEPEGQPASTVTILCFSKHQLSAGFWRSPTADNAAKRSLSPARTMKWQPVLGYPFRKTSTQEPYSVIGEIKYHEGKRPVGIEAWRKVIDSVEVNEEDTYTYLFSEDMDDEQTLCSFERYVSKSFLWDVHVPSNVIQQNIAKQKDIRTGLRLHLLRQLYMRVLDE